MKCIYCEEMFIRRDDDTPFPVKTSQPELSVSKKRNTIQPPPPPFVHVYHYKTEHVHVGIGGWRYDTVLEAFMTINTNLH